MRPGTSDIEYPSPRRRPSSLETSLRSKFCPVWTGNLQISPRPALRAGRVSRASPGVSRTCNFTRPARYEQINSASREESPDASPRPRGAPRFEMREGQKHRAKHSQTKAPLAALWPRARHRRGHHGPGKRAARSSGRVHQAAIARGSRHGPDQQCGHFRLFSN